MNNTNYSYNILEAFKELDREEPLKESRSVADIEAEIARLQQELEQAKIAEKKTSYGDKLPAEVWIWDIYLEPSKKGTWTSAELYGGKWDGTVFETEEKALDAAWDHLSDLEDENELYDEDDNPTDPDDYYVEAFSVNISDVDVETLKSSKLEYLIPANAPIYSLKCCECHKYFKISQEEWDKNKFKCPHCKAQLEHN